MSQPVQGPLHPTEWRCDACGGIFARAWTQEEAEAEAAKVFRPEEIDMENRAEVCDVCWTAMRQAMPDLDARYAEQGIPS